MARGGVIGRIGPEMTPECDCGGGTAGAVAGLASTTAGFCAGAAGSATGAAGSGMSSTLGAGDFTAAFEAADLGATGFAAAGFGAAGFGVAGALASTFADDFGLAACAGSGFGFCAIVNVFTVFALGFGAAMDFGTAPVTCFAAGFAGLAGFACNGFAGAFMAGAAGLSVLAVGFAAAF